MPDFVNLTHLGPRHRAFLGKDILVTPAVHAAILDGIQSRTFRWPIRKERKANVMRRILELMAHAACLEGLRTNNVLEFHPELGVDAPSYRMKLHRFPGAAIFTMHQEALS